jgi:AcrR family transcriptional regulator
VPRPSVDERRREILEATCKVVIERGFANTRIADVANELGVSSGLIHYHFESKALFAEALRYAPSRTSPVASTVPRATPRSRARAHLPALLAERERTRVVAVDRLMG